MYQMSPDLPRQLYAELLRSRAQERATRRTARSSPAAQALPFWRAFALAVKPFFATARRA
jgi:hypothetical protein